jgi:acyl-CoA oxidase
MDLFCLRERDLLKQFVEEVSLHLAQGESREKALMLVKFRFHCALFFAVL